MAEIRFCGLPVAGSRKAGCGLQKRLAGCGLQSGVRVRVRAYYMPGFWYNAPCESGLRVARAGSGSRVVDTGAAQGKDEFSDLFAIFPKPYFIKIIPGK